MEEYKKCYEDYEISNFGNCRRMLKNGKYLYIKGSIQNRGYRYFQINRKGKRTNTLFHHLVAKTFLGERPEGLVIDHIDRNKLNNNVSNLRYITFQENLKNCDRYRDDIKETDPKKRATLLMKLRRKVIIKDIFISVINVHQLQIFQVFLEVKEISAKGGKRCFVYSLVFSRK